MILTLAFILFSNCNIWKYIKSFNPICILSNCIKLYIF